VGPRVGPDTVMAKRKALFPARDRIPVVYVVASHFTEVAHDSREVIELEQCGGDLTEFIPHVEDFFHYLWPRLEDVNYCSRSDSRRVDVSQDDHCDNTPRQNTAGTWT